MRIKTVFEFENEFGPDWRKCDFNGAGWNQAMDPLFGRELNSEQDRYIASIGRCTITRWTITSSMVVGNAESESDGREAEEPSRDDIDLDIPVILAEERPTKPLGVLGGGVPRTEECLPEVNVILNLAALKRSKIPRLDY